MAIEQFRDDMRFHLALFNCIQLAFVRGIALFKRLIGEFRIDGGNEGNPFSVRRPDGLRTFSRDRRQLLDVRAVIRHRIDLERAVAVRFECDALAVGRPALMAVLLGAVRQLFRLSAAGRNNPDVAVGRVVLFIDDGDGVGDPLPIGRYLRICHALSAEHVFEFHRAFGLREHARRYRNGAQNTNKNCDEDIFHGLAFSDGEKCGPYGVDKTVYTNSYKRWTPSASFALIVAGGMSQPYLKFFHIIDSTGLTVRLLYLAERFRLYGTSILPSTIK